MKQRQLWCGRAKNTETPRHGHTHALSSCFHTHKHFQCNGDIHQKDLSHISLGASCCEIFSLWLHIILSYQTLQQLEDLIYGQTARHNYWRYSGGARIVKLGIPTFQSNWISYNNFMNIGSFSMRRSLIAFWVVSCGLLTSGMAWSGKVCSHWANELSHLRYLYSKNIVWANEFSIHTMKSITHAKEGIHSVFYTLLSVYILFNQLLRETCLLSHFSLGFFFMFEQ